jgi:hypothetical protein
MTWKSGFAATASKVSCFVPPSSHLPGGLDDFAALVIPQLQHRGLPRASLRGETQRQNLGLRRPKSSYSQQLLAAASAASMRRRDGTAFARRG